ncbi:MAG: Maf family protein [Myxococcota bacterium]
MTTSKPPVFPETEALLPVRLILASASPRRRMLLSEAGLRFEVQPSTIEERTRPGEPAEDLAERLAREKAADVAGRLPLAPPLPVLGADTIVVIDDDVLGKPRDPDHAVELLTRLMGRQHRVMTGIALAWSDGRALISEVVTSRVEMREASRAELIEYVALGESLDKAGGYALQGAGRRFVVRVLGSSSNVIGLPIEETLALFERGGAKVSQAPVES